jgi:peptidoglycan/xylan/chitin deacetylase (PgdA/CDA1 family)
MTLNWDEIRRMVASGMSVGGHTQNHRILPMESEELAQDEINGSKLDLESHLDSLIEGFAYPNGGYTPQIQQLVQQAGYEYACSMEENSASFHSDRYALPRRDVNEVKSTRINGEFSPAVFEATIQGIFNHPMKWLRRSGVQERFHHGRQKCSAVNS